jgi:hypothetical protein
MLVLLVAATKILVVKAGALVGPACLPCFGLVVCARLLPALALIEVDFLPTNMP